VGGVLDNQQHRKNERERGRDRTLATPVDRDIKQHKQKIQNFS